MASLAIVAFGRLFQISLERNDTPTANNDPGRVIQNVNGQFEHSEAPAAYYEGDTFGFGARG